MDRYKGDRSDSDSAASGTPRDDRFFTPRQSARLGSSSDGESWATPRSTVGGPDWLSDEGEYATPREFAQSQSQYTAASQQSQQQYHPQHDQSNQQGAYPNQQQQQGGHPSQQGGYSNQQGGYQPTQQQQYQGGQQYPNQQGTQGGYSIPEGGYPNQRYGQHTPSQPSYGWQSEASEPQHQGYKYDETQEYWHQAKQESEYLPDYASIERSNSSDHSASMPKDGEENLNQAIDDIFSFARHNRVEEVISYTLSVVI